MSDSIKEFTISFFSNLQAKIEEKEGYILVSNVSKDFEDYIEKKSPYCLIFNPDLQIEGGELMTKGSFMLRVMMDYLENKGQTTLLNLIFDFDSRSEIDKNYKLKNCEIFSSKMEKKDNFIIRFTFQTVFQYLNEKEKIVQSIYTSNGQIINFELEKYNSKEGENNQSSLKEIKQEYLLAKEQVKSLLQTKKQKIEEHLSKKLDKEIERIKSHYSHQILELEEKSEEDKKHLFELENQLTDQNANTNKLQSKIEKTKQNIEKFQKSEEKDKLVMEEKFFINDEIHKHSLNISTKLINTTIISYPKAKFEFVLKNKNIHRNIILNFNPVNNSLDKIFCDSCKNEINNIYLCNSGHLSCANCLTVCGECREEVCKSCQLETCNSCYKTICKKCSAKCLKCGKYYCRSHIKTDPITKREMCVKCLRPCSSCNQFYSTESMVNCSLCNKEICPNCAKKNIFNGKLICLQCTARCPTCGNNMPKSEFKRCPDCKSPNCNYSGKCLQCRRQMCLKMNITRSSKSL
ncbi:MAG: hypothetical protein WC796_06165 [Candidatus Pacearchaeota archaeon]|jgi:hypothetical protein